MRERERRKKLAHKSKAIKNYMYLFPKEAFVEYVRDVFIYMSFQYIYSLRVLTQ